MAAARTAFRVTMSPLTRPAFRPASFRQPVLRQVRRQTTAAGEGAQSEQSTFSKFLNSKVGPKTVHFWAPIMKWGLVVAGLSDLRRPPESLSLQQNLALMATGCIWTRWCFIIKPQNLFLASVNFCVFLVASTQVTRIFLYRRSLKNDSVGDELKSAAKEVKDDVEGIVKDPKRAIKNVQGA